MSKTCVDCNYCPICQIHKNYKYYDPDTCEYNPDNENKRKQTLERVKAISEEMKTYEHVIFPFDHNYNDFNDFKPFREKSHPTENGLYLTIRCGLSGIYTVINEWKDDKWQMNMLDDSETIAFCPKIVTLKTPILYQLLEDIENLKKNGPKL